MYPFFVAAGGTVQSVQRLGYGLEGLRFEYEQEKGIICCQNIRGSPEVHPVFNSMNTLILSRE
jgi:hypothetical protein